MDFFRSILSDDPSPPVAEKRHSSGSSFPTESPQQRRGDDVDDDEDRNSPSGNEYGSNVDHNSTDGGGSGLWSFGGLIKTLATRSESVLETYRRDLHEFGSGLRRETDLIREVATKAVKDLPASLEVGASVAHGSMETVGHAIDGVLKSTAEMISHGKETILAPSDNESDTADAIQNLDLRRYNRFDAQLRAIQGDANTYCEEPEDVEDYRKWKQGYVLQEKTEEVESLIGESAAMEDIYKRAVPNVVDRDTFWCRYFYRVHKLKQQDTVRANLVKRAIAVDDDEDLSWDVDDDDEDSNKAGDGKGTDVKELGSEELPKTVKEESSSNNLQSEGSSVVDEKGDIKASIATVGDEDVVVLSGDNITNENARSQQTSEVMRDVTVSNSDGKGTSEDGKVNNGESSKDSKATVVPGQQKSLPEDEDLGWDEIEDLGSDDDKKVTQSVSSNQVDVRKRLSAAEEDEDLSWAIEEDDEPVKA